MTKPRFHITKSGAADVCNAKARACPLGGEHYDSMPDAMKASLQAQLGSPAGADEPFEDEDQRVAYKEHARATVEDYSDDELRDTLDAARTLGAEADIEVLTEVLAEREGIARVEEWSNQAVQKGFFDSMDASQLRAYLDNGPEDNTTEGIKKYMAAIGEAERRDDEARDAMGEDAYNRETFSRWTPREKAESMSEALLQYELEEGLFQTDELRSDVVSMDAIQKAADRWAGGSIEELWKGEWEDAHSHWMTKDNGDESNYIFTLGKVAALADKASSRY